MGIDDVQFFRPGDPGNPRDAIPDLALVLAWSTAAPHRAGEIAFCEPNTSHLLGRGDDDSTRFLRFSQQRPGQPPRTCPDRRTLFGGSVSRRQLEVHSDGVVLEIDQFGGCPTFVNGAERRRERLGPGDTLRLGREAVLLCVRRARSLPGRERELDVYHAFGIADADGVVGESGGAWKLRRDLSLAMAADNGAHAAAATEGFSRREGSPALLSKRADGVYIPSLRERREDIPLVARHLLIQLARRDAGAAWRFLAPGPWGEQPRMDVRLVEHLLRHPLHGDVGELRELLLEAAAASSGDTLKVPPSWKGQAATDRPPASSASPRASTRSTHPGAETPDPASLGRSASQRPSEPPQTAPAARPSEAPQPQRIDGPTSLWARAPLALAWCREAAKAIVRDTGRFQAAGADRARSTDLPHRLLAALVAVGGIAVLVTSSPSCWQQREQLLATLPCEVRDRPACHHMPFDRAALRWRDRATQRGSYGDPCNWPSGSARPIYCFRDEGERVA
jgi:hypothetical protein